MPRLIFVRSLGAIPSVSFRGSLFSDTINQRTYSTTIDLGAEDASRLIVVGTTCVTGTNEAPTSCTVDGASATLAVQSLSADVIAVPAQLWYVARPTGGSVTVAFNKPGGADMDRGALAVWAVYSLNSQTPGGTNTNHAAPADVSLTVPNSAIAIGACGVRNVATYTWTVTGLTTDAIPVNTLQLQSAFGSAGPVTAGARTITFAGSAGTPNACSAYWR